MTHRPVPIDFKEIQHLASLPYRRALEVFVSHVHDCEPCAEVFEDPEAECADYCHDGHSLLHITERKITEQNLLSRWN